MFGKKLLFLAAWYVAGNVVSSLYSTKKGKDLQSEMKKAKKSWTETQVFISNVLDTQKNFFSDIRKLVPKEHEKAFQKHIDSAQKLFVSFKEQWSEIWKDLEGTSSETLSSTAKKVGGVAKKVVKKASEIEKKTTVKK